VRTLTLATALAGTLDTLTFVITRRKSLVQHRGRGAGTLVGLALWAAVLGGAARGRRPGRAVIALTSINGLTNWGLLAAHLRRGIPNARIFLGPALATIAAASTVARAAR
jgi:hypothetical protein